MKHLGCISFVCLMWLAPACSTHQGGTGQYNDETMNATQARPVPTASPSQRPGMTPEDPRDPQFITRPQPLEAPPTTKP